MTAIDTWPVQVAIVDLLQADEGLMTLAGGRVHDEVPAEPIYPYVSLGPSLDVSDRTSDGDGIESTVQIDIWSRQGSFKEARAISAAIRTVLDCQSLLVTGLSSCISHVIGANYLRDPDGVTRHGVLRVRLNCRE